MLAQKDKDGLEHVVAYGSHKLSGAECKWAATEGECYAVVYFAKEYRVYFQGQNFTLVTDHAALKWIMKVKDINAKWARWALRPFGFEVVHRPGKEHANADGLSRLYTEEDEQDQDDRYKMESFYQAADMCNGYCFMLLENEEQDAGAGTGASEAAENEDNAGPRPGGQWAAGHADLHGVHRA